MEKSQLSEDRQTLSSNAQQPYMMELVQHLDREASGRELPQNPARAFHILKSPFFRFDPLENACKSFEWIRGHHVFHGYLPFHVMTVHRMIGEANNSA
jgi:hypothetical protein